MGKRQFASRINFIGFGKDELTFQGNKVITI